MGHVLLAYELLVIMIGFAALSIAGSWAYKSRESYLRDFCILYTLFTGVMIVNVLIKYSSLNIQDFRGSDVYALAGINMVLSFAVVVASIHFFHEIYGIKAGRVLTLIFLVTALVCMPVLISPVGVVYHQNKIEMRLGALLVIGLHNLFFTYALIIGFTLIGRIWKSKKRSFVIGLLIFASIGYIETVTNFINNLRVPVFKMVVESDFIYSSIPYALYGIFIIFYFLQNTIPAASFQVTPLELISRYGITDREQEIIQKVVQGKSNAVIAGELFISLATVKTHLNNIYKKMDADGRFDLITRIRSG